jgi:hypothetical protein
MADAAKCGSATLRGLFHCIMADGDLSDEQLKQLLKDAEQRLKEAKANDALQGPVSALQRYVPESAPPLQRELSNIAIRIPKVASSKPVLPYVSASTHGAHIDPSYLVNTRDRKLSSGPRTVQDPMEIKAKAAQVSPFIYTTNGYHLL